MFPSGSAGWGLLLLRLCAAGMLLREALPNPTVSSSVWEFAGLLILGAALCAGIFTPLACVVSIAAQIFIALRASERDSLQFAFSLSATLALFLLGPGAFSIDSRLFGRRLIVQSKSD